MSRAHGRTAQQFVRRIAGRKDLQSMFPLAGRARLHARRHGPAGRSDEYRFGKSDAADGGESDGLRAGNTGILSFVFLFGLQISGEVGRWLGRGFITQGSRGQVLIALHY